MINNQIIQSKIQLELFQSVLFVRNFLDMKLKN
jgi:hypothetical protein